MASSSGFEVGAAETGVHGRMQDEPDEATMRRDGNGTPSSPGFGTAGHLEILAGQSGEPLPPEEGARGEDTDPEEPAPEGPEAQPAAREGRSDDQSVSPPEDECQPLRQVSAECEPEDDR